MKGLSKTSDKFLAGMLLGGLVLVVGIHLALYAQFRTGHIIRWRELQEKRFTRYHLAQPSIISLTGTIWVNIYPSDSFYIELPKQDNPDDKPWMMGQSGPEAEMAIPQYAQSGDTLSITGDVMVPIHRPFADFSYSNKLPRVNIYTRELKEITLRNGQLVLDGAHQAAGAPAIRLTATNSTVWVAHYDEFMPTPPPLECFDSLDLHLSNTVLLLNRSASIRSANIHLDASSELNDRWSTIGRSQIIAGDSSRIDLTGANLKKATIDIHR
jgi:hypothetical protein